VPQHMVASLPVATVHRGISWIYVITDPSGICIGVVAKISPLSLSFSLSLFLSLSLSSLFLSLHLSLHLPLSPSLPLSQSKSLSLSMQEHIMMHTLKCKLSPSISRHILADCMIISVCFSVYEFPMVFLLSHTIGSLLYYASCIDLIHGLSSPLLHAFLSHHRHDKRHMQRCIIYSYHKTVSANSTSALWDPLGPFTGSSLVLKLYRVCTHGLPEDHVLHHP
jgi:hypothetical protein